MSDDMTDSGLIDVSGFSLSELRDHVDGSSLESALRRISTTQHDGEHHSFSANI
jgi:hypothetical protein